MNWRGARDTSRECVGSCCRSKMVDSRGAFDTLREMLYVFGAMESNSTEGKDEGLEGVIVARLMRW